MEVRQSNNELRNVRVFEGIQEWGDGMSVLIKGMEMPETCMKFADGEQELCPFVNTDDDCILQDKCYGSWEEMHATCPLIEIPTPHGDLVDRDAMITEYDRQHEGHAGGARRIMVDAKAVIEAEGNKE